jgi:hypothetical protein
MSSPLFTPSFGAMAVAFGSLRVPMQVSTRTIFLNSDNQGEDKDCANLSTASTAYPRKPLHQGGLEELPGHVKTA